MSSIKSRTKRTLIPKVKNDRGETITSRKRIFGELSTPSCMLKLSLEKKFESLKTWKQERATKRKAVAKTCKLKY